LFTAFSVTSVFGCFSGTLLLLEIQGFVYGRIILDFVSHGLKCKLLSWDRPKIRSCETDFWSYLWLPFQFVSLCCKTHVSYDFESTVLKIGLFTFQEQTCENRYFFPL